MDISPKERFLDICHFKRPGDLCMISTGINAIAEQTLEKWVEQGAPKEIRNTCFRQEYFGFEPIYQITEVISGPSEKDWGESYFIFCRRLFLTV